MSYEDWIVERLQDRQEVDLYIEACLDVFREDRDIHGLVSALELFMRAQNQGNLRSSQPVDDLNILFVPQADLSDSDFKPTVDPDRWPTTISKELMGHARQPGTAFPYPNSQFFPKTSDQDEERWDSTDTIAPRKQYSPADTFFGANTWGNPLLEKDKILERQ